MNDIEFNREIYNFMEQWLYTNKSDEYLPPETYGWLLRDGTVTRKIYGKVIFEIPEINFKIYEAKSAIYVFNAISVSGKSEIGVNYRFQIKYLVNDWKEQLKDYIDNCKIAIKCHKEVENFVSELRKSYRVIHSWIDMTRLNLHILSKLGSKKFIATGSIIDVAKVPNACEILKSDIESVEKGDYDSVSEYTSVHLMRPNK